MEFVRIYTGDDGQTHFQDLDLPGDRAIHSGMQVTPGVSGDLSRDIFPTGTRPRAGST